MSARDRLDEIEEQLREYARWLQVELRKTEKAIGALAENDEDEEEDSQSLSNLVLQILREAKGHVMTIPEVHAEARRRGWSTDSKDPVNVVRAALARLNKSGELERPDSKRGAYRIRDSSPGVLDHLTAERAARITAAAQAEASARHGLDRHAALRTRLSRQRAEARQAEIAERAGLSLADERGSEQKEPSFVRPHAMRRDEEPF
ncbi:MULTISPECIES: hypothetical protein [Nocardiaceae]|jgi:hypothetical protein|uniref:hypothetical protein n=1 Tax=Nocardiaceae TaxID=85025 RepID=UPI000563312D|nr:MULTISPECIES: hypothetical protein [Rhodococcus]MCZ4277383.1 hypothetical protein [Rhodococcus yunnanensis]